MGKPVNLPFTPAPRSRQGGAGTFGGMTGYFPGGRPPALAHPSRRYSGAARGPDEHARAARVPPYEADPAGAAAQLGRHRGRRRGLRAAVRFRAGRLPDPPGRRRPPTAVDGSLVAPFGRHLAFGADPEDQMRVGWQVPFAVRRPYLRVGLKPWDLGRKIEAEVRDLHTPSLSAKLPAVQQFYLHARAGRPAARHDVLLRRRPRRLRPGRPAALLAPSAPSAPPRRAPSRSSSPPSATRA